MAVARGSLLETAATPDEWRAHIPAISPDTTVGDVSLETLTKFTREVARLVELDMGVSIHKGEIQVVFEDGAALLDRATREYSECLGANAHDLMGELATKPEQTKLLGRLVTGMLLPASGSIGINPERIRKVKGAALREFLFHELVHLVQLQHDTFRRAYLAASKSLFAQSATSTSGADNLDLVTAKDRCTAFGCFMEGQAKYLQEHGSAARNMTGMARMLEAFDNEDQEILKEFLKGLTPEAAGELMAKMDQYQGDVAVGELHSQSPELLQAMLRFPALIEVAFRRSGAAVEMPIRTDATPDQLAGLEKLIQVYRDSRPYSDRQKPPVPVVLMRGQERREI
ncbi:MAG: hypothetical protein ACKVPX_01870 [Myxococcaceae bacterium]